MQITVKLFASYRVGRFKESLLDYPKGATIARVLEELQIPPGSSGAVLLNGHLSPLQQNLQDGDTLVLFPLVAGG